MLDQQLWNLEPSLPLGVLGDHRLVRVQGIAGRRALMRGYFGVPHHSGVPVHPRAQQQILAFCEKLQHFHEINIEGI
jgi:hypothetical protein